MNAEKILKLNLQKTLRIFFDLKNGSVQALKNQLSLNMSI